MWTQVSMSTTVVWDEALWLVTATWRDDDAAPPVVLTRAGRAPLHGEWRPTDVLAAALSALEPTFGQIESKTL